MSEFMDVVQFHKNDQTGKWRVQRLGYAKPNKDGTGWDIYLDALPMPTGNFCRISMQKPRQQQDKGQDYDPSSEVPF